MTRRTFVADASILDLEGELLITVYGDNVTIAYRKTMGRTWGPPMIAVERK